MNTRTRRVSAAEMGPATQLDLVLSGIDVVLGAEERYLKKAFSSAVVSDPSR
jgi:hypothetical protein